MTIPRLHTQALLREITTEGNSPLLVMGSDYQKYVAKNDKGKTPPTALINECLCSAFLAHWQINRPDFAVLDMDLDLLESKSVEFSKEHKAHYYNEPSYASHFIENAIDMSHFLANEQKAVYNKFTNPLSVLHIALFDTWIENDDRRGSNYNLILKPENAKFEIFPIDHAFVFSSLSYNHLNPNLFSPSANEHLLDSELGRLIKKYYGVDKDFINREKEYFYVCINSCKENFELTFQQIALHYPIDATSINNMKLFLFNEERNAKVFDEYIFRLKQ